MSRIQTLAPLALALAVACAQAHAQDAWYASLGIASASIDESDQRIANAPAAGSTLVARNRLDRGTGWNLAAGRGFGHFRAEIEYARFDNDSDSYAISAPITANVRQTGKVEVESLMLNGYWDFGAPEARLRPFVGLGLGRAEVSLLRIAGLANNPAAPPFKHLDNDASGFAWQASVGLAWQLNERFALAARYRRFDGGDFTTLDQRGEKVRGDTQADLFDLALRISF